MSTYAILEVFKTYLIKFFEYKKLNEDDRLLVGSVILEYLSPLMADPFIMDEMIAYFFYELFKIDKKELQQLAVRVMKLHFSSDQLKQFAQSLISVLC